jgi:4-amino-4-deoxy-L-arabinose transferase-like glycosyltransferase
VTVLLIAVALTWRVDGYPLFEPDEGRNAEVMREMAASNGYLLPRLNGLPYLDKPIVSFAAGAVAMEIMGPTEKAARLPSIVFTVLTILLVAWFGRRLFGRSGAWTAALAYAASPLTIAYARTVIFDAAFTFWVAAALVSFFLAAESPPPSPPPHPGAGRGDQERGEGGGEKWWGTAGWLATAAGVLTKGPVILVFVLFVALPYALWRRRWRAVVDPVGLLAGVAIVLPWVLAVSRTVPDFLSYVLTVETVQRVATSALGRTEPFWYFVPILLAAGLPWTVAIVAGWRRDLLRLPAGGFDRRTVFLLLWIALPFLFFSLSQSKRPQYILPLMPALGLLLARLWHAGRDVLPGVRAAAGALVVIGGGLIARRDWIAGLFDTTPAVAERIPATALALGLMAAVAGSLVFAAGERRQHVLLALAAPACAIPLVGMPLLRAIGADRSSEALAEALAPVITADTEVVGVEAYPLSLPFYLRRPLTLATRDGAELTSNYVTRHVDLLRRLPGSTLRPADWWREALALCRQPRVFVVGVDDAAARDILDAELPLRGTTRKVAAYGPCGLSGFAQR